MNFKFRSSMDDSRPPLPNPNPNLSYFTQQALRAGFGGPDARRRDFGPNPVDIRGSFQRELEKERIRAEIIAEEIVRRRILEDEVRREMMMEREMTMHRGERRLGFGIGAGPGAAMRFDQPRVSLLTNFEHRSGVRGVGVGVGVSPHREVRLGFGGGGGGAGFETRPFQRGPVVDGMEKENGFEFGAGSSVSLKEIKEVKDLAPENSKDKVIILAKPSVPVADLKRKAMTLPIESAEEASKKIKTKDDWSCALCRITATSERGLNEHLQGKKHKSRERGMLSQRTGFGTSPLPKISTTNTGKLIKVAGSSSNPSFRKDGKAEGESSMAKVDKALAQNPLGLDGKSTLLKGKETSKEKREDEKKDGKAITLATVKPKKKFRFMCETCQVGTYSLKVMNAHKKGKRHLALLEQNKTVAGPWKTSPMIAVVDENKAPEFAAKELEIKMGGEPVQISDKVVPGKTSLLKGEVEENDEPELVMNESNKATEGELVENNKEDSNVDVNRAEDELVENNKEGIDGDVNRAEDKNKVLKVVGSETLAEIKIDPESARNEADG